ncbi:MAG TPA: thiol:disulfide interchange protein DsbA/DsbL [Methylophilaceae bacterium]|jgi:thiol:disulfide interchange protein DsbA
MKSLFASVLMLLAFTSSYADTPQVPKEGTEYLATPQVMPTDNPAKIEVTELFWYGCPHCYHLEPTLEAWVKKLPKDVEFKRVPGIARPEWVPMAKAYYTLEAFGLVDKLHSAMFDAIHKQRVLSQTADEPALIDWITKQSGLDRKKVEDTFRSFSVTTKVSRAYQVFQTSGATGVPSLIVEGRYLTSSTLAGSTDDALRVTDYLIAKSRAERAKH